MCDCVTRLPPPCDHVWIINTELSPALQSTLGLITLMDGPRGLGLIEI